MTSLTSSPPPGFKPKLWVPGDWNAFFGFGTNILVNLLTLTGLLRFVLQMPADLVFKRILPAAGLMMCMSTMYYASLAYRLAKKTGRNDVCALPSGISVPHMFIVTLVIMLPVKLATGDPDQGLAGRPDVGLHPELRADGRRLPRPDHPEDHAQGRAARRAGRCLHHLHLHEAGAGDVHDAHGRRRLLRDHPRELVRRREIRRHSRRPGRHRRRHAHRLGLQPLRPEFRRHERRGLKASFQTFGFAVPHPAIGLVLGGLHWSFLKTILVTAIPFGIYDLVEAMDNVVSASAAGDEYPTTRVLTADGVVSLIGCLMGNPYINAVYIGHPGWKAMGGRIGYSAATGVMVIILSWFGVISLMTALIPVVAISPILLYIGMLIGSQAFQESPHRHAPAIVVALVPSLAAWGKLQIDNSPGRRLRHPPGHARHDRLDASRSASCTTACRSSAAAPSSRASILGAMTTFIIDRDFSKASGFAAAGAVLTFFGLMHGEEVDLSRIQNPGVVAAYLTVAGVLYACHRFATVSAPSEDRGAHALADSGHEKDALATAQ